MKKFIVIAFMALAVTMIATVPAKASDVTPTATPSPTAEPSRYSKILVRSDGTINPGQLEDLYTLLLDNQKMIVNYLIGLSNYMYMAGRGFKYDHISIQAEFVSRLLAYGEKFFGDGYIQNTSRLTPYMQQMIAAFIVYAKSWEYSFDSWLNEVSQEGLYIPYASNMIEGWTTYYNDPSVLGVIEWGSEISDWDSGTEYDFQFSSYNWYSSSYGTDYQNFMLNKSPVIYTNVSNNRVNANKAQIVISLLNKPVINTLYVLKGDQYNYFRFGDYEGNFYSTSLEDFCMVLQDGEIFENTPVRPVYRENILQYGTNTDLLTVIQYAFNMTPVAFTNTGFMNYYNFNGYWFPISHVVLVDDLNTLSNREELYNVDDLDISGGSDYIIKPKEDKDIYYRVDPSFDNDIMDNLFIEEDNSIRNASDDDIDNSIVNNTVINNYNIVAPGSKINVPVNWLESDGNYLDYTNTTALPFFVMVSDIFNALGEIRIFIVGVLILGLAGGVLVKFLL